MLEKQLLSEQKIDYVDYYLDGSLKSTMQELSSLVTDPRNGEIIKEKHNEITGETYVTRQLKKEHGNPDTAGYWLSKNGTNFNVRSIELNYRRFRNKAHLLIASPPSRPDLPPFIIQKIFDSRNGPLSSITVRSPLTLDTTYYPTEYRQKFTVQPEDHLLVVKGLPTVDGVAEYDSTGKMRRFYFDLSTTIHDQPILNYAKMISLTFNRNLSNNCFEMDGADAEKVAELKKLGLVIEPNSALSITSQGYVRARITVKGYERNKIPRADRLEQMIEFPETFNYETKLGLVSQGHFM